MVITVTLLLVSILFPLLMILGGRWILKDAPNDINSLTGYRTKRSMASKEALYFANMTAGKYWFSLGRISLPIFAGIALLTTLLIDHNNIAHVNWGIFGITAINLILFLSVIPYTEKKLKSKFK